jgi:3-methyladenine DNA glycosylase/8-oxoguanine DNA glycosylase
VRKGYAKTFRKKELPKPKELQVIGEKWRPYRSVAAWYFWRALDAPIGRT